MALRNHGSTPPGVPPRPRGGERRNSGNPTPPAPPKKNMLHSKTVGEISPHLTGSPRSNSMSISNQGSLTLGGQFQSPPSHPPPLHCTSGSQFSHSASSLNSPTSSPNSSGNPPPLPHRPPLRSRPSLDSPTDMFPPPQGRQQHQPVGGAGGGVAFPSRSATISVQPSSQQTDTYVVPDTLTQLRQQHRSVQWQQQQQQQGLPSVPYVPLEDQDWYWGSITKEDVTDIMKDMPNGAFLVRDAARVAGYYTLTLRKGGVNRLIRIMNKDGQYGFAEPLEFKSIMALVEYYKGHSLAPYSPKLDITLGAPVSRRLAAEGLDGGLNVTDDYVIDRLRVLEEDLRVKSREYNSHKQSFERVNEEIQNMRTEISAQQEIINIIGDSLKEHEKHHNSCTPALKTTVMANFQLLERRHRSNKDSHLALQEKLLRSEKTKNCLDTELNSLKPEIKQMQAERGGLYRTMNRRGMSNNDVASRVQGTGGSEDDHGEEEEEEGLYATYAMLHTIRKESDYQRISEEIRNRKDRRPPPAPLTSGEPRNPGAAKVAPFEPLPPLPAGEPPRNIMRLEGARMRMNTMTERPPLPRTGAVEEFDGHLINTQQLSLPQDLPHYRLQNWMNPKLRREDSRDMLNGKPNGTFLVRPKGGLSEDTPITTPTHSHTIDIVDRGKFKRIPVFRDPGGGFGFAPPYEFDSLHTLVLYYATNTMEKHNPDLETTLMYPAFSL